MSQVHEIIITDEEIQDSELIKHLGVEIGMKLLLKRKGMPVMGNFNPRLDPDYEYQVQPLCNATTSYKWKARCQFS